MRISDWSSDVCSSDLHFGGEVVQRALVGAADIHAGAAADRLEPFQYLDRRGVVITGGRGRGSEQVVGHDDAIRAGESGAQAGAGYGFINAARIHSRDGGYVRRSEEHTSELQSLMRNSYAVFCLKKKKHLARNTENNKNTN